MTQPVDGGRKNDLMGSVKDCQPRVSRMSSEKRWFGTVAGIRDRFAGLEHLSALLAFDLLNPGLVDLVSRFGETIERPDGVSHGTLPRCPSMMPVLISMVTLRAFSK